MTGSPAKSLALVLSGGGARAAYQAGVLAGIAERLPRLEFPIITGVSAGAINTCFLASHPGSFAAAVERLKSGWVSLTADRVYRVLPGRLASSAVKLVWHGLTGHRHQHVNLHGLVDTEPLREFLSTAVDLSHVQANISARRLRAVALSATSYTSGRSVTFVQGATDAPLWARAQRVAVRETLRIDHVMASAALPIIFPAIRVGDEYYGDGSVSHLAPLAPAIHLGARAIVAIGSARAGAVDLSSGRGEYPSVAQVFGLLFRAVFLDTLEADAERLERINRTVASMPAGAAPENLRHVDILMLRPSRNLGELAAGHEALLPPAVRFIMRAIGAQRDVSAEFLGHFLFHPEYTSRLAELGYSDVAGQWPEIEQFLARLA